MVILSAGVPRPRPRLPVIKKRHSSERALQHRLLHASCGAGGTLSRDILLGGIYRVTHMSLVTPEGTN